MEQLTITQVCRLFDVTPRMLRHYEKMGLIRTVHIEDYAYRLYDETALRRIRQIILLRKLRLPLKSIAVILEDGAQRRSLEILQGSIAELDSEIASLDKIRSVLQGFAKRLSLRISSKLRFDLLDDAGLLEAANTLTLSKTVLKENTNMNELKKAEETLNRKPDVRIVLLPPCTVASYHFIGPNPEEAAGDVVDKFVRESNLYVKKPDSRMFGFNRPNPGVREDGLYGYEVWVTVPEDMEVPGPLERKAFAGGLYGALTIQFPEFEHWNELIKWADENDSYAPDFRGDADGNGGCLEEHLNWVYASHHGWPENGIDGQLDLMIPIQKKA